MHRELTKEERAIVSAWKVEGRSPEYHREQVKRLRRDWPVLVAAIEALVRRSPIQK